MSSPDPESKRPESVDPPGSPAPLSGDPCSGLTTLQRNAIAQFLQRRDFTPHDIAQYDYAQIARLPKIGRKGIDAIRGWLRSHGCDLRNTPEASLDAAHHRGEQRLDKAVKLLQRNGYEIQPPKK